jgi:hypothetical protein
MRHWPLLACAVLLAADHLTAQVPVRAATAAAQVGQVVIVEDVVAQVARPQGTPDYFLNFGSAFPNQVLTAVVPAAVALQVPGLPGAAGSVVRVRGTVTLLDGRPAIRCSEPDQVEILTTGSVASRGPSPVTPPGCVGGHHACGHDRQSCATGHHGCAHHW